MMLDKSRGGIVNKGRRCSDEEHEELFKQGWHACYWCSKILQYKSPQVSAQEQKP